jgi:hypothetical protein
MSAEAAPTATLPTNQQPTEVMDPTTPGLPDLSEAPTVPLPIVSPEPAAEPEAFTDEALTEALKLQVVDVSHGVVANAIDHADAHLAEQTTQSGFKGFMKRIWHGNIARDFIRQRQAQRGRETIVEDGNIYALKEGSRSDHDRAMAAVITRFSEDYLQSGERQDQLENVAGGEGLERQLRVLVNFFAQGSLDVDTLREEKNRILQDYGNQLHEDDRNKGLLLADNVIEVAQAARTAFNHGVGMDRIQAALTARAGEAQLGARTEARRTVTDRIVDKVHSSRVGSLVNETTVGVVAAVVVSAAKFTTRKTVTAAAAVVGMGVGAGLVAGAREHARVGEERAQHLRERATGQLDDDMPGLRREQMEATRYETVAASELTSQLAAAREAVASAEPVSIAEAVQQISEVRTRLDLSDQEAVDLISFSSVTNVEQERLQVLLELAETTVATRHALGAADEDALTAVGLERDLDAMVADRSETVRELLQQDLDAKDAAFNKLRRNRTLKMSAVGLVTGVAFGTALQEARAVFSEDLQGVFESDSSGQDRRTLLAGLLGHHGTGSVLEATPNEENTHNIGKNATLSMPNGFHMEKEADDRHWQLINGDGERVAGGLAVNAHGELTEGSQASLQEAGYRLSEDVRHYETSYVVQDKVERSPKDYLNHHKGDFTHVSRELWYDNNTPNVFDQNELRLWWGGENNTGFTADGDYVFNIEQMAANGSFHNEFSADAQRLINEGKLSIAISMDRGTQSHVVMIPIDKHGNAVIDGKSWMAHSLFEKQNGQAHFRGAYAEVVQHMGTHDGKESVRMLATVVGDNDPREITDSVSKVIQERHQHVTTEIYAPTDGEIPVEIPPVLPIYSRRGLEVPERLGIPINYLDNGNYLTEGYRDGDNLLPRRGLAPFAPELEADPNADIDAAAATKRYLDALPASHRRTVSKLAETLGTEPKAAQPKVVVMIPAAAHQEGRNIFNTLQQYAQQEGIDRNNFEVVVFANYPHGQKPDQTIKEVRRFQKENPGMVVRLVEKRLEDNEAKIGWIRKALTDTVITDLVGRNVSLDNVMLVSNDADSQWINPNYLRTIVDKAEASPETDGFLGFIDWGYDAYKAHPEILAGTRFMQMIEIYLRIAKHEIGSSGANFAFRPGIYTAVGGYRQDAPLAEDVFLGRMIKSVRAGADTRRPIAFLGRSSEVNTSARRALDKLFKDGGAPAAQWDDEFGVNDELRNRDFELGEFNFDDPAAVERMVQSTERMLNQTLRLYSGSLKPNSEQPRYREGRLTLYDNETIRQLNRICFFLGLGVNWEADGHLTITDAQKMIDGMRGWNAKH